MEPTNNDQAIADLTALMNCRYKSSQPSTLLPLPDQTTANLLDAAAASASAALYGADIEPRDGLRRQIKANADLLATGDTTTMAESLSRQATALELAMYGLLAALNAARNPDHRLALARAVATVHGAALRSLSALRQISIGPA